MKIIIVPLIACLSAILPAQGESQSVDSGRENMKAWEVVRFQDRDYVTSNSIYQFYRFVDQKIDGQGVWFTSPVLVMKAAIGSKELLINNIKFILSNPVEEVNGKILFSRLDLCKLIDPVLRPSYIGKGILFDTVIVDPGHGGSDSGAKGILGDEKDYTLQLAMQLKDQLEKGGLRVVLTRKDDTFISQKERVNLANAIPNSIFVSLQFSGGAADMSGIETYALAPQGTLTQAGAKEADVSAFTGNQRDSENIALATAIHASAVHNLKLVDRGVQRARSDLLEGLKSPGVEFHGGFIASKNDAPLVATPKFRTEMARLIGIAITNYRRALIPADRGPTQPLVRLSESAGLPTAPVLRIEAEMHTASINRTSMDAAGHVLLTVSSDKSARLWELPSGRLLRVLRPPMGEGNEGELFVGALSPHGFIAAVGGWTRADNKDGKFNIYLFETVTGRLIRRLEGLPSTIHALAFSASGRFLAAGLFGKNGIRVWDIIKGGLPIADNAGYGAICNSVAWHGDERLATTSGDCRVRLYEMEEKGLHPLKSANIGADIASACFSPNGAELAVVVRPVGTVEVLDGQDLSLHFQTDPLGADGLNTASWSADGQTLAASGARQDATNHAMLIRLWDKAGRGKARDVPVAQNTVLDLHSLPWGGFLFGAADPVWGIVSESDSNKAILKVASPAADFRGAGERFRVAADGTAIAFSLNPNRTDSATFSLSERRLTSDGPALSSALRPPRLDGLPVMDWLNTQTPVLRSQYLPLEKNETSRCLAIAPDASFFLLGTARYLRCFSARGEYRWGVPGPSETWAVNLSADGALALAAFGDGTIRWYRADNGRELLAFFPHADQRRWALWTPEGYYDCSPGAEDLIGWHVNRGKDQAADFFPAARFRAIYYRPDVISRVLKTMDASKALHEANVALGKSANGTEDLSEVIARLSPPVVELTSGGVPASVTLPAGADHVNVRYRVRNTGKEHATHVDIRLNGRPVEVVAPLPAEGQEAEVNVTLPGGLEGELSIIASHKFSSSEAAILRFTRESGHPVDSRKPDLYIVAVGAAHLKMSEGLDTNGDGQISDEEIDAKYSPNAFFFDDLRNSASDAQHIADVFQDQQGKLFGRVITRVLLNQEATTASVREALHAVAGKAQAGDVVLFFFSGHGYTDAKTPFFLVTHDTQAEHAAATALTGSELTQLIGQIKGSAVLFLDTCHAGAALDKLKDEKVIVGPEDLTGFVNTLSSSEHGVVVLSSSSESEESFESNTQGYFTQAVIEGIKGQAGKEGRISCTTLQEFITRRVPELVGQNQAIHLEGKTQTPSCIMPKGVPDFALALTPSP